MEIFLIQGSLRQKVFKASKRLVPLSRGCTDPFHLPSPGIVSLLISKMKPDFLIYAHTHTYFILLLSHLRLNCRLCTIHSLSKYMSPKSKDFSFITTVQLSHSRKLISEVHTISKYIVHIPISIYTSNISYSCFLPAINPDSTQNHALYLTVTSLEHLS